jgi:hypothetical protein
MATRRRWRRIAAVVCVTAAAWYVVTVNLWTDTPRPAGWNLRPPLADAEPVTADAMMPGIYPVGSRKRDLSALGGFGPCDNYSVDIENEGWGKSGELSLVAFPDEDVAYFKHQGIALRVLNRSWSTVTFEACDSELALVCEAKNSEGTWQPIESAPESFCGNSYHRVFLPSGQCWELPARVYAGPMQTKLRFRLDQGSRRPSIYSNEFDGQISPAQFKPPGPPQGSGGPQTES